MALGLGFLGLFFALRPVADGVAGVAGNLAVINIAIGLFNLVPGFPLDGGRSCAACSGPAGATCSL